MTTDQALNEIQEYVQWCREEGETDLRGILYKIKSLRKELADNEPPPHLAAEVQRLRLLAEMLAVILERQTQSRDCLEAAKQTRKALGLGQAALAGQPGKEKV